MSIGICLLACLGMANKVTSLHKTTLRDPTCSVQCVSNTPSICDAQARCYAVSISFVPVCFINCSPGSMASRQWDAMEAMEDPGVQKIPLPSSEWHGYGSSCPLPSSELHAILPSLRALRGRESELVLVGLSEDHFTRELVNGRERVGGSTSQQIQSQQIQT